MKADWTNLARRMAERSALDPRGTVALNGDLQPLCDASKELLVTVHPDVVARVDFDLNQPERARRCAVALAEEIEGWEGDVAVLLGDDVEALGLFDSYPRLKGAVDEAAERGAAIWLAPETEQALAVAGADLAAKLAARERPSVTFSGGLADRSKGCLACVLRAYEAAGGANARVSEGAVTANGERCEASGPRDPVRLAM